MIQKDGIIFIKHHTGLNINHYFNNVSVSNLEKVHKLKYSKSNFYFQQVKYIEKGLLSLLSSKWYVT